MTILSSFAVLLLPSLLGILILHFLWEERSYMAILFKACLGIGLGLGLNSLVYFISLLLGLKHEILFFLQAGLLAALTVVAVRREFSAKHRGVFRYSVIHVSRVQWLLIIAFFMALLVTVLIFVNLSTARPQGARDAWSIWNRAARFIYRDPENWSAALAPELFWVTHPDYPLLIPLNVAWGWQAINHETNRIPIIQSALYVLSLIGLLFAATSLIRTTGQAALASMMLMSAPILIEYGFAQIADIPLSFFILAACVCLYLYFKYEKPGLLVISGFATGLAAWTKNEGMLFVMAVSFAILLCAARTHILTRYACGLALPLLVVFYFKFILAPANDIFFQAESTILEKLTDPARYRLIARYFFESMSSFPGWPINIFVQLGFYTFIMKYNPPNWSKVGNKLVAATIMLQLLGYCLIYMITPHDLEWHLYYSFNRLIFHLFPAILFLLFCNINEPEFFLVEKNLRDG